MYPLRELCHAERETLRRSWRQHRATVRSATRRAPGVPPNARAYRRGASPRGAGGGDALEVPPNRVPNRSTGIAPVTPVSEQFAVT
jgi:hypothetical protein